MLREPKRRRLAMGALSPVLFGLVFAGFGAAAFFLATVHPLLQRWRAADWTPTRCTVLDSRVDTGRDSEGDEVHHAKVRYRYRVGGSTYKSGRIQLSSGLGETSSRARAEEIRDRYPVGGEVSCFYDPAHPEDAVLERTTSNLLFGLFPLAFFLLGIGVMGSSIRELRGKRRRANPPTSGPIRLARHEGEGDTGLLIRGGFALAFTFAASAIGAGVVQQGGWSILFLLVFGSVAVGLQMWFWHRLLGRIGPRIEVTVEEPARLGDTIAIEIRMGGRLAIRHAAARLIGREEASHGAGTDRVTDTETFFQREIGEIRGSKRVALRGELRLPTRKAAPTFHGEHNHIRWLVALQAEIAFWPDVDHEYELEVGAEKPGE